MITLMIFIRGVQAVHYLMFSDNLMVRRAAAEAFCNLGNHEKLVDVSIIIPLVHAGLNSDYQLVRFCDNQRKSDFGWH
jgi:hypothetical protein